MYAQTPWQPGTLKKKVGQVRIEVDELWSFIGEKQAPRWVWLALDSRTRQVVGMAAGDRDEFTARCLWESLPPEYRERALVATDLLPVYQAVVPDDWHATGGKEMVLTAHVERFFGTLRQRCQGYAGGYGGISHAKGNQRQAAAQGKVSAQVIFAP